MNIQALLAAEGCEMKYISSNGRKIVTCSEQFNCCDCGGNECGCRYCFSCCACDHCKDAD